MNNAGHNAGLKMNLYCVLADTGLTGRLKINNEKKETAAKPKKTKASPAKVKCKHELQYFAHYSLSGVDARDYTA